MIAAIYARKSTEQFIADDQKSVTRQVTHARAFATARGWVVHEAYVFVDDGDLWRRVRGTARIRAPDDGSEAATPHFRS